MSIRRLLLALMLSTVIGMSAAAQAQGIVSTEHPIETSTNYLILPSDPLGSLTCGDRSFQLTAETTYWVGERALTFAQFGQFLQSVIGKPRNGAVLLTLDLRQVTRVYVAAD